MMQSTVYVVAIGECYRKFLVALEVYLANSTALPGLLATVSELKTHLVLPADLESKFKGQQGLWHFGYEKTTILKFGPNSSLARS